MDLKRLERDYWQPGEAVSGVSTTLTSPEADLLFLHSGLSFLAIAFDSIFVVQHFVLYKNSTLTLLDTVTPGEENERRPLLGGDEERAV